MFPVLVPVKSSFMQIKYQREENEWLGVWENFVVPFYSWGQIFDGHSEILLSVCITLKDWELDRLRGRQTGGGGGEDKGSKGNELPRWPANSTY